MIWYGYFKLIVLTIKKKSGNVLTIVSESCARDVGVGYDKHTSFECVN